MRVFAAKLDKLYEMLHFIKQNAGEAGIHEPALSKVELASEELLVNVINHGYPGRDDGEIEISCIVRKNESVEIIIKDQGIAFDPVAAAKNFSPGPANRTTKKSVGGYGIYFVIKMMDDVEYQRAGQTNIIRMTKRVPVIAKP